jgi:hypothetical protein
MGMLGVGQGLGREPCCSCWGNHEDLGATRGGVDVEEPGQQQGGDQCSEEGHTSWKSDMGTGSF